MTHCDRILARLERGPATAAELYAETYSIVHSRISDLRRRGYVIECERVKGQSGASSYLYRLGASHPFPSANDLPNQAADEDAPITLFPSYSVKV